VGVVTAHGIELLGNDGMLHPAPAVGDAIEASLKELSNFGPEEIRRLRREKYLQIGTLENA
ncbi:MAG: hypothetical protein ACKVG0_02915, partial [Alphaproteobacteria bacterium]